MRLDNIKIYWHKLDANIVLKVCIKIKVDNQAVSIVLMVSMQIKLEDLHASPVVARRVVIHGSAVLTRTYHSI